MNEMHSGSNHPVNSNAQGVHPSAGTQMMGDVRNKFKKPSGSKMMKSAYMVLLVAVALVLGGVVTLFSLDSDEGASKFVKSDKYQAVFVSGEDPQSTSQAYFGKLTTVDNSTYKLTDIYYLTVTNQVQPNSTTAAQQQVQLTRLGCELHGPESAMYINKSKVLFWENLKDDGKVVTAISDYLKQNPGEQKCDQPQQTTTPSTTTPTTTPSTTKP